MTFGRGGSMYHHWTWMALPTDNMAAQRVMKVEHPSLDDSLIITFTGLRTGT